MARRSNIITAIVALCMCLLTATTSRGQTTGACCLPNGTCVQLSKCECESQGFGFAGPGTTCASVNCSQVVFGACCLATGCFTCSASICTTLGGTIAPNMTCGQVGCASKVPVPCCCGSVCTMTDYILCGRLGGLVINPPIYTCQPNPCAVSACCDPATGACQFIAPCPAGWNPITTATSCNPNPCIQVGLGVCCDAQGNCSLIVAGTICQGTALNNIFSCNPNPCPPVPCCDATGNCTMVAAGSCSGTVPASGSCQPNPCITSVCCDPATGNCTTIVPCPTGWTVVTGGGCSPVNPCPPGTGMGACCDYRGPCYPVSSAAQCPGVFFPNQPCGTPGFTCPQFGSCCQPCTGACMTTTTGATGCPQAWTYNPTGTCAPNTCSQTPIFGSCCFVPATGGVPFCGQSTSCDCVFKGGSWLGSTPCTPANCTNQALGACCHAATQVCTTNVTTLTCQDSGGVFYPGQTCTTVAQCNQPTSACCCCGLCHNMSPTVCALSGGTVVQNAVCGPYTCMGAGAGACCDSATGTCTPVPSANNCSLAGQTFYPGQTCAQIVAICSPAAGACCDLTTGNCLQILQQNCTAPFFQWVGGPCSPLVACLATAGACCNPASNQCFMVSTSSQCLAPNLFLGIGITCTPGVICHPPTVACCNPTTGYCQVISGNVCPPQLIPSTSSSCSNTSTGQPPCPQPGACCNPATGQCVMIIQAQCPFPIWLANATCNPNPCGPVACCDPNTGNCQQFTGTLCPTGFTSLPGQTCQPINPCPPIGACCPQGSAFCITTTQANCNGNWTQGVPCSTVSCVRACCRPDGSCFLILTYTHCPLGTTPISGFCQPNQCPRPGPCCNYFTGACSITQQSACVGKFKIWGPAGGTCTPSPCLGACCDPVTRACVYTPQWGCPAPNYYFGGGVCTPNPCNTIGPCCFNNGTCAILTQAQCSAQGGFIWFGPGSTCTTTSCVLRPCCLPNGSCATIFPSQCAQQGGVVPNAPSCGPTVCRGACCTPPNVNAYGGPVGTHCVFTFQSACQGQWRGYGTTCANPQGSTNFTTCCPANVNGQNGVSVQDIFDFLAAFFAGCTGQPGAPCNGINADFNNSGIISPQDIFDFLAAYFVPCS